MHFPLAFYTRSGYLRLWCISFGSLLLLFLCTYSGSSTISLVKFSLLCFNCHFLMIIFHIWCSHLPQLIKLPILLLLCTCIFLSRLWTCHTPVPLSKGSGRSALLQPKCRSSQVCLITFPISLLVLQGNYNKLKCGYWTYF